MPVPNDRTMSASRAAVLLGIPQAALLDIAEASVQSSGDFRFVVYETEGRAYVTATPSGSGQNSKAKGKRRRR